MAAGSSASILSLSLIGSVDRGGHSYTIDYYTAGILFYFIFTTFSIKKERKKDLEVKEEKPSKTSFRAEHTHIAMR